jgi:hypothetical protein
MHLVRLAMGCRPIDPARAHSNGRDAAVRHLGIEVGELIRGALHVVEAQADRAEWRASRGCCGNRR